MLAFSLYAHFSLSSVFFHSKRIAIQPRLEFGVNEFIPKCNFFVSANPTYRAAFCEILDVRQSGGLC